MYLDFQLPLFGDHTNIFPSRGKWFNYRCPIPINQFSSVIAHELTFVKMQF